MDTKRFHKLLAKKRGELLNSATTQARLELLQLQEEELSDEADNAAQTVQHEVASRFAERDHTLLAQIDEALSRIQEGSFGDCEYCGEPIAERRLEVQPWARYCVVHAELLEKKSGYRKAR